VAFTAILRVRAVVGAAGEGHIADRTLLVIGLFSMLVSALFLLGTRDFKRMLAYSSVETHGHSQHWRRARRGGRGGGAVPCVEQRPDQRLAVSERGQHPSRGRLAFDGRRRGMSVLTPRSAAIFVAGMFAVTALPPFAPFFSELLVLRAALASGQGVATRCFSVACCSRSSE